MSHYTNVSVTFTNVKDEQVQDIIGYASETFPLVGAVHIELYHIPED